MQQLRAHGQVALSVVIGSISCCKGRGLWLLQSVGEGAPSSSTGEPGDVCLDCVHSAGISSSLACDRVTAYLISRLLLYCVVSPVIL